MILLVGFVASVGAFSVADDIEGGLRDDLDRYLETAAEAYLSGPGPDSDVERSGIGVETIDRNGNTTDRAAPPGSPDMADVPAGDGYHDVDGWRVLAWSVDGGRGFVAADKGPTDQLVANVRTMLTAMIAAVWLSLALAMLWLLRSVVRPLAALAGATDAVTGGDTAVRVDDTALVPEVAAVGAAMNRMLDAQQRSLDAERAANIAVRDFVADASHELRTPLTAISGWADLIGDPRISEARRAQGTERIRSETRRLASLVDDLLALARADQGRSGVDGSCQVVKVAGQYIDDHDMLDPTRPVELQTASDTIEAAISGDAFGQIISNLLSNLRNHTPEGTAATITIDADDEWVRVRYRDNGPGVTNPSAVFGRFWQEDSSRNRVGTGLGMSVVAAIAGAVGGHVDAATPHDGGVSIQVDLPAAEVSGNPQETARTT